MPTTFPTKGPQNHWILDDNRRAELEKLFPGTNLDLELSCMLAWLEKNGAKTARGMPLFVLNWLRRAGKAPPEPFQVPKITRDPIIASVRSIGEAEIRRMEIWKQMRDQGMTDAEAKAASYEAWLAEGWGK